MQIVPVINCRDRFCVEGALATAEKFLKEGDWIKIDIADGIFTYHKTWNNPTDWANLRSPFKLEVHLMVENPEKHIEPWIAAGAKRLIVHAETVDPKKAEKILEAAKRRGVEIVLSSNPETPPEALRPYLKIFSLFQVLAVNPGLAGQKFLPVVLEKIKFLRKEKPDARIEVDGGINLETARQCKAAGADSLAVASYIFENENPKKAYEALKKL